MSTCACSLILEIKRQSQFDALSLELSDSRSSTKRYLVLLHTSDVRSQQVAAVYYYWLHSEWLVSVDYSEWLDYSSLLTMVDAGYILNV